MELTQTEMVQFYKGRCPDCLNPVKEIKTGPDHMNWVCVVCKSEFRLTPGSIVKRTIKT